MHARTRVKPGPAWLQSSLASRSGREEAEAAETRPSTPRRCAEVPAPPEGWPFTHRGVFCINFNITLNYI